MTDAKRELAFWGRRACDRACLLVGLWLRSSTLVTESCLSRYGDQIAPGIRRPAGRTVHSRIIHDGAKYIRWILIEAARHVSHFDSKLRGFYLRVAAMLGEELCRRKRRWLNNLRNGLRDGNSALNATSLVAW